MRGAQNRDLRKGLLGIHSAVGIARAVLHRIQRYQTFSAAPNMVSLHGGVGAAEEFLCAPAEPHFLEPAAVGTVAFPFAPAQARFGNIRHQDFADLIQLNTGEGDQEIEMLPNRGDAFNALNRQVQSVIIILYVVISHHAVKGRVTQFFHHGVHPLPAVVSTPHRHLVVLPVPRPLDQRAV